MVCGICGTSLQLITGFDVSLGGHGTSDEPEWLKHYDETKKWDEPERSLYLCEARPLTKGKYLRRVWWFSVLYLRINGTASRDGDRVFRWAFQISI